MHLMRHISACLVVAIILTLSVNGVAVAANAIGHQTHCLEALGEISHDAMPAHAHEHEHAHAIAAQHAIPDHDHETCMTHACPALSGDALALGEHADTHFAKLIWPEVPLHIMERPDGLKRPPKS